MALKSIDLDDRRFQDLMDAALERARRACPEWTDMTAGDPGRVLLELFAFLTEAMLYRLNRLQYPQSDRASWRLSSRCDGCRAKHSKICRAGRKIRT